MPVATTVPDVDDLKRHMRIRHSQDDEDLEEKLAAAIDQAAQFLNRPIPWPEDPDASPVVFAPVPPSVRAAILIQAAELCANREASVVGAIYTVMPTARNLLNPYRVKMGV
ncbi:DNA-packaging protein [Pseudomonas aeruginosa]|uniref:head-tail connector protein n=1 Tax=Pseudomonas aeruginosa TaxID=287 RepID=UPI000FFC3C2A|nr:head-tail connector protein [Pseudomonas aeruginosa]RMK49183.1 DNA-packaging protein [Pseudomonas aeruginosa]